MFVSPLPMDSITAEKKKTEKSNDQSEHAEQSIQCRMESLQDELIMEILSRVPTLDLPKLRYVRKRWNNILNDPLFPRLNHSHSMSNPNETRVLMLKSSSKLHSLNLAENASPRLISIDLPNVPDLDLDSFCFVGSCNGLLCLGSTKCSKILVMNPFTRQQLVFPMHIHFDAWSWGFGFDENTKLFKVVVVGSTALMGLDDYELQYSHIRFDSLEASVCDLGSDGSTNWRSIGATTFIVESSRAHLVNGRLHWAYRNDDDFGIISFDLADEEFRPIPIPDFLTDRMDFDLSLLGGCLCIFSGNLHLQIWVMKDYGVKASWVKERDTQYPLHLASPDGDSRIVKVLGSLRDGEPVLLSRYGYAFLEGSVVFSSNSTSGFKHLKLRGLPFGSDLVVIHTVSLNWV